MEHVYNLSRRARANERARVNQFEEVEVEKHTTPMPQFQKRQTKSNRVRTDLTMLTGSLLFLLIYHSIDVPAIE